MAQRRTQHDSTKHFGKQLATCTAMVANDQSMMAEGIAQWLASIDDCQVKMVASDLLRLVAVAEPPGLVAINAAMP
jgi:hypothetical protein